jgi:rare lipoprotein A
MRLVALCAAAVALASCVAHQSSRENFSSAEQGVPTSPKVVADDRPMPQGGGHYMVGDPYRVAGHTYVPKDYKSYSAIGLASWYGPGFRGRHTANGEVYDVANLTAAHPTLPLPSYAMVTNLANGRSVMVRINDRGPFRADRLIDVSASVAELLGFARAGTTKVKVDYAGPARIDGLDRKMLLASYRGPKASASDSLVAANQPATRPIVLASDPDKPLQRQRPVAVSGHADAPVVLTPASSGIDLSQALVPTGHQPKSPAPPPGLRTFASSDAPDGTMTDAVVVADCLANSPGRHVMGTSHSAAGQVIQLGVFADPANASRVAATFCHFGRTEVADVSVGGRALQSVRVIVDDPKIANSTVMAAAAAGLNGARVNTN